MRDKKSKYPVPEGFDPFIVIYNEGASTLRSRLLDMDIEHLKGILAKFTSIPRKTYAGISDQGILTGLIIKEIKDIACRDQAFGDYKLMLD